MKEIDCRGMACPAPVLKVKRAIENGTVTGIKVIVDNEAAKENVNRFLGMQSFDAAAQKVGDDFIITGNRKSKDTAEKTEKEQPDKKFNKIMVMVTTDRFGHGDDVLGEKLMGGFLKTLNEMGDELWKLVFINTGVKLAIEGANTAEALKTLEDQGIHILLCGTCLTHFDLMNKNRVGEVTNMLDVVTAMQVADKVITI